MIEFHGDIRALLSYVERVEMSPIERVGEPGDGSVTWQRTIRIKLFSGQLTLTLMTDELEALQV